MQLQKKEQYINLQMDPLCDPLTTRPIQTGWEICIEPYPNRRFGCVDNPDRQSGNSSVLIWTRTRSDGPEPLRTQITGNRYQECLWSPLQEEDEGVAKDLDRVPIPPYHQSRTPPRPAQAHPTPPLQVKPALYLNVQLSPHFQSPLGSFSHSQNPDCGIAV